MFNFKYSEINEVKGFGFKYVIAIGPIDFWELTLSKEQIISNIANNPYSDMEEIDNINNIENYVTDCVEQIEEEPHTVRYTSTPYGNDMSLIAIAKISNNGTCFVFSNDFKYLEYLKESSY